jgi:tetratricopeptide (TPR) repeat protein
MECYERSLAISRQIKDREGVAICLYQQGIILLDQGAHEEALKSLEEALAMSQAMGDLWGEALAKEVIGEVHGQMGDFTRALEYLNEALVMAQELGHKAFEAECLKFIELFKRERAQPRLESIQIDAHASETRGMT